jgi:hypothetical protein
MRSSAPWATPRHGDADDRPYRLLIHDIGTASVALARTSRCSRSAAAGSLMIIDFKDRVAIVTGGHGLGAIAIPGRARQPRLGLRRQPRTAAKGDRDTGRGRRVDCAAVAWPIAVRGQFIGRSSPPRAR